MSTKKEIAFKITKGYRGRVANNWILARRQAIRTLEYQNVSRKLIKLDMRKQWIQQINAATRQFGISYGQFIHGLDRAYVNLNRKMLAELAVTEPFSFQALTEYSKGLVPWKNRDSNRMTMKDYDDLKKDELPPEWEPKNFESQVPALLNKRIAEQYSNASKKADEINEKLIKSGKVVPAKIKKKKKTGTKSTSSNKE